MKKGIISVFLALMILLSCLPVSFALYKGDVNEDGSLTSDDARTVLRAAVGLDFLDAKKILIGDIDGNGTLSADDARSVLRMAVGLDQKVEFVDNSKPPVDPSRPSGKIPTQALPADGQSVIRFRRSSLYPYQDITVKLNKIIRGDAANKYIEEWSYEDAATSGQEWRFYFFEIGYVSDEGNAYSELELHHLIDDENIFYRSNGGSVQIAEDTFSLSKGPYAGMTPAYTTCYPEGSVEVVYGILVPENAGDLLIKIPYDAEGTNTWVKLTCDNVVTDYEEDKPENTLSEDDPVNVAAKLWILTQGKMKNPSSFQVHNIYVKDKYVYLWYSANNGFGGAVDGCARAYYDASLETEGYEFFYNIEAGDGLIRANVDATLPSTWDSTVSISAVEAQKAIVNTIKYTYKELSY